MNRIIEGTEQGTDVPITCLVHRLFTKIRFISPGNVAYNKPTNYTGKEEPTDRSDEVVDGRVSGEGCRFVNLTSHRRPRDPFWQVDLGALYRIYNVTVYLPGRIESRCNLAVPFYGRKATYGAT